MADINVYDDLTIQDYSSSMFDIFLIETYESITITDYTLPAFVHHVLSYDSIVATDYVLCSQRFQPLTEKCLLPVRESLIFNTEILQSHDRTEQRISKRRGIPERHISYKVILETDQDFSRFETVLHRCLKEPWAVPIWPLAVLHTGTITAGEQTISVDTNHSGFNVGSYAMIWQNRTSNQTFQIVSSGSSSISLSESVSDTYTGNKFIIPCRGGRVISFSKLRRFHGCSYVDITFRLIDYEDVIDYEHGMMYDNFMVLDTPAKFPSDGVDYSYDPDVAVLETGSGPFEVISNSTYNLSVRPHRWICETKQVSWELRQFFHKVNGRQKGFLVPTFGYDLELSQNVGAGDTGIYVVNQGFSDYMGYNEMRTYLAFRPSGSDIIVRRITGISEIDDDEELITIESAPGDTFSAGDYLCWVDLCRLANDEISFNWFERGKCSVDADLVRVIGYEEPVLEPYGYGYIEATDSDNEILDLGAYSYNAIGITEDAPVSVV